jgi:hypothetical protein
MRNNYERCLEVHQLLILVQLEYFPLSIRDFTAVTGSFAPFVSLGGQISYYDAKASSTLGPLGTPATTFPKYLTPSEGRPSVFLPKKYGLVVTSLELDIN